MCEGVLIVSFFQYITTGISTFAVRRRKLRENYTLIFRPLCSAMEWILSGVVAFCVLNNVALQYADEECTVLINNQSDLDQNLEGLRCTANGTAPVGGSRPSRNITIKMNANDYILDIVEFVNAVNLTDGDVFTLRGTGGTINISCSSYSNTSYDLLRMASFKRALEIVYDGITFTSCPAPLRIEDVTSVIIENCVFQ